MSLLVVAFLNLVHHVSFQLIIFCQFFVGGGNFETLLLKVYAAKIC